jgi:hypothetical protein
MLDLDSVLEAALAAGIVLPEAAHGLLGWCAAIMWLFVLLTAGTVFLALMLCALRWVRVASHRLFEPVRPRRESGQIVQLLREIVGADKRG